MLRYDEQSKRFRKRLSQNRPSVNAALGARTSHQTKWACFHIWYIGKQQQTTVYGASQQW